jgi:histidyl-tRNA synthetase
MIAAKANNLKRPVRWYSIPRLFRYERMQKGRLREFFQLNMDILGIKDAGADAELIAAVIDMMRDLGFTAEDFTVHISSRTLLEELFLHAGIARENLGALYALLDKKHKIPPEDFLKELSEITPDLSQQESVIKILSTKTLEEIGAISGSIPAYQELKEIFSLLGFYGMGEYVSFDIGIVRGLAYYTGTVFEVFDKKRTLRAIAGGGRYDKLVKLYGGPDTPAIGFGMGDVVLGELLREKAGEPALPPRSLVYVVSFNQENQAKAIETAGIIRRRGISCEFSLKKTGVGKQMEQAHAARSRRVVFVGGEEEKEGKIKIKNMETGEEILVPSSKLPESLSLD